MMLIPFSHPANIVTRYQAGIIVSECKLAAVWLGLMDDESGLCYSNHCVFMSTDILCPIDKYVFGSPNEGSPG